MRVSYSTLVKAKRAGRATSVRVAPTGTAVEQYQVPLGNRQSLREVGVIGLPSWSDRSSQSETWARVPRLSATCPRRIVAFDGGRGDIDRTMEFGDDFDGTTLNTAKWTLTPGGGTITVSGGTAILNTTAGADTVIWGIKYFPENHRFVARYKIAHNNDGYIFEEFGLSNAGGTGDSKIIASHQSGYLQSFYNWSGSAGTPTAITGGIPENTFFRAQCIRAAGVAAAKWTIDNRAEQLASASYVTGGERAPWLRVYGNPAGLTVDLVFVTKWTANGPLAGTAQPATTNRALSRPMRKADLMRACCT